MPEGFCVWLSSLGWDGNYNRQLTQYEFGSSLRKECFGSGFRGPVSGLRSDNATATDSRHVARGCGRWLGGGGGSVRKVHICPPCEPLYCVQYYYEASTALNLSRS